MKTAPHPAHDKAGRRTKTGSALWSLVKIGLPAAIILALFYLAFAPKPVAVDAGVITLGPMRVTVDDEGVTRVRERFIVSSPLSGTVLRIAHNPGDSIGANDNLATIIPAVPPLLDPRSRAQAEAMVGVAEASLESAREGKETAEVNLTQATRAHDREQRLYETGTISDAAIQASERLYLSALHADHAADAAVRVAQFQVAQAEAALLRARGAIDGEPPAGAGDPGGNEPWNFEISSPIDGKVLRLYQESSRTVLAGTPLVEIGDPSDLEISIDVLSQQAVRIHAGQVVHLSHWGGEAPLEAVVRQVEPSAFTVISALGVDEQRVNVIVDFAPEQATESLGDGYRVEAEIVVWEKEDALMIPTGALFRKGGGWAAFKITPGGHATLAPLEIGENNGDVAEVLDGLSDGDSVVLHPANRVDEGTRIKVRRP